MRLLRFVLIISYLTILLLPGLVFFSQRGGFGNLQTDNFRAFASFAFPLFGLYAFTLIWLQTIIGMNLIFFNRFFNQILNFHRVQGLFALLLATTHAFSVPYIFGLQEYITLKFLPQSERIFAFFGSVGLYLLLLTVFVAFFRSKKLFKRIWRYIHYLNYFIFIFIFIHSKNLGSDVTGTALIYLWYFFLITFLFSFGLKLYRLIKIEPKQTHTFL